jgi:hypothetical protein
MGFAVVPAAAVLATSGGPTPGTITFRTEDKRPKNVPSPSPSGRRGLLLPIYRRPQSGSRCSATGHGMPAAPKGSGAQVHTHRQDAAPTALRVRSMAFKVEFDSEMACVATSITGDLDKEVINAFFMEVGKVAGEHECTRVLSDLREATITAPLADIYEMAKAIEKKQVLKSFRRAIVISKDHQDYAFWETVCYNQGHRMVRIFQNYDQARKWVLSE